MSKVLFFTTLLLTATGQAGAKSDVMKAVEEFAQADNAYDITELERVTDSQFQFLMRSKGGQSVDVISREAFLKGVQAKKFGGHSKKLKFQQVVVHGNVAAVYFTLKGQKFGFHHFGQMIKVGEDWKLVSIASDMEFYN